MRFTKPKPAQSEAPGCMTLEGTPHSQEERPFEKEGYFTDPSRLRSGSHGPPRLPLNREHLIEKSRGSLPMPNFGPR
jgi:hypothetical protein